MDSKNIKYLLAGGAALVAAALAIHFFNKGDNDDEESVEEVMQRKIQELLPIDKDAGGIIPFHKFLKIFEMCAVYGRTKFGDKKKEYIAQRREALAEDDMPKYERVIF